MLPGLECLEASVSGRLISAGFDAYRDDPIGGLHLTSEDFRILTQEVVAMAKAHTQGKVISVLEGGYHLNDLGKCVAEHLSGLMDLS